MQAGAKPRRAPAAKGEQQGGQARGTRLTRPALGHTPQHAHSCPSGEGPSCRPWHVPRAPHGRTLGGWEPLCFLSFKLQYSLKGEGGVCVVLSLPLHLMAGFA